MTTKLDLQFKIEDSDGMLYVSYNGGCTWEAIGVVRGDASVVPGPAGKDGADGVTPHINTETGTWWVGSTDTEIAATGPTGTTPHIQESATQEGVYTWWIGEDDTEIPAVGAFTTIAVDSTDIAGTGTPSIVVTRNGDTATLAFKNLKGVKGDKGDTGPQGLVGPQGSTGEKGDPGEGIHFTEHNSRYECLAPNYAYTTSDGDLMVRLTEEGAELPTPEGVDPEDYFDEQVEFVNLGNLKGSQGEQGPQGPQGPPIYFTTDGTYDSDLNRAIFSIENANPGDYLVYIGNDTIVAPVGQLFQMEEGLDDWDRQIWTDQGFSIKGEKGDVTTAEGLVPSLKLVDILDPVNPALSYQELQASFNGFQTIIHLGTLKCRSIKTIYQVENLPDADAYYTFRVEYTDGTNYDLKIKPNGGVGSVPKKRNELLYSDDETTLTTHSLMFDGGLVVDNATDFAFCKNTLGVSARNLILDVTTSVYKVSGADGSRWDYLFDTSDSTNLPKITVGGEQYTLKLEQSTGTAKYEWVKGSTSYFTVHPVPNTSDLAYTHPSASDAGTAITAVAGTPLSPFTLFKNGSRIAWNGITDKLFYNDGSNIYRIASVVNAGYGINKSGNTLSLANTVEVLSPTGNAVTINYDTYKFVRIDVHNEDTLTVNVHLAEALSTAKAREVICRIVNVDVTESLPAIVKVAKTADAGVVGTVTNMYDADITGNSGIGLNNGDCIELVFTFWNKNDVTFNGGEGISVL